MSDSITIETARARTKIELVARGKSLQEAERIVAGGTFEPVGGDVVIDIAGHRAIASRPETLNALADVFGSRPDNYDAQAGDFDPVAAGKADAATQIKAREASVQALR